MRWFFWGATALILYTYFRLSGLAMGAQPLAVSAPGFCHVHSIDLGGHSGSK
jgi:hypothetical protein